MRRRAKILCGFGFIELLVAILVLIVFEHMPSPWGAGTMPDGFGKTAIQMEALGRYENRIFISFFGAAFMGVLLLIGGGIMHLVSKFTH